MKIGIIDYKAGNVQSVLFALQRLGYRGELLETADELNQCDKLIFPGVGHAKPAMEKLKERQLDEFIRTTQKPLLGICLGMQLLCKHSEEGDTNCIGVFDVNIKKFSPELNLKIPQIGWNTLTGIKSPLFSEIKEQSYVYFVHSYYAELNNYNIASCNYGIDFCSALRHNNYFAVQFHPEKSGKTGEKILRNFLSL